jgi:hypothetical protein
VFVALGSFVSMKCRRFMGCSGGGRGHWVCHDNLVGCFFFLDFSLSLVLQASPPYELYSGNYFVSLNEMGLSSLLIDILLLFWERNTLFCYTTNKT